MKTECSIVRDLLPLYAEDLVSAETAQYIREHLEGCAECQAELTRLREGTETAVPVPKSTPSADGAKPFKRIMRKMNRQFDLLAYSLIIFFVFLGFSWTAEEAMMYNSLIMPIVGIFGYYVFRWKAIYKMPILLLILDTVICLCGLVELDLLSALLWTALYSMFVWIGVTIAFLLHYAFRKENK